MLRFELLNLIAGALQLVVPSYALRLLRRFGVQRVGWFVVIAFAALAMAHLMEPARPKGPGALSGITLDAAYAVASVLLLIGMGHLETILSERARNQRQHEKLRADCKREVDLKTHSRQDLVQEIARRTQEIQVLKESEEQYRLLFIDHPEPMFIFDLRSFRLLAVNKAALRLYGAGEEEFLMQTAQQLFAPESASAFAKQAARPCSGSPVTGRWHHRRLDGTPIEVELIGQDLKYGNYPARLVVVKDVSRQHERELKACQAQKMEIIAQLAGRFALHFNNILSIIDGQAELLLNAHQDPKSAQQLKRISEAAKRAAGLTSQLVTAGGRQHVQLDPFDLNGAVRELTPMLHRLIDRGVVLQIAEAPILPHILADGRLIEHIIVHLVLNARAAMPSGGTLRISTAAIRMESPPAHEDCPDRPREFIRLTISDTGCGMSPDVQSHLFEPFFTTRDVGQAVGLGLASVYGAVKQHKGWIEYKTEPGEGTEFRIYFPIPPASEVATRIKPQTVATPTLQETILLVEGDERARGLARFVLNRQGYRVIEADCATTALLLFESQAGKISLVLIDMNLPDGIPAPQLARHLKKNRPELKIVYTAAPEEGPEGAMPAEVPGEPFIPKPFGPDRLLLAVQACLAQTQAV